MHKIGHGGTHFTSWAQELRKVAASSSSVTALVYSRTGKRLVAAAGTDILILDASKLEKVAELNPVGAIPGAVRKARDMSHYLPRE